MKSLVRCCATTSPFCSDVFTDISDKEFRIYVVLDVIDEENEPPSFFLQVRYPEDYPDEPPQLDLLSSPNAPVHPNFSISDDRDQLLAGLEETIQENIGMAMIFSVVSTLKESAEQLIQDRKDVLLKQHEEQLLAAEREENKKFHGTAVTPETFVEWRDGFVQEMEEEKQKDEDERLAEMKKARVKDPTKLTGRQLWERGLVGKIDEFDDDEDDVVEGVENLKVEA